MHRLFVGLELPDFIVAQLLTLRMEIPGARWQSAGQLHMTLNFIGQVDEGILGAIIRSLKEFPVETDQAAQTGNFRLTLSNPGFFGSPEAPKMLWLDVRPHAPLATLHEGIETRLAALGLERDPRRFKPHLTLARLGKKCHSVAPFLARFADFQSPVFEVRYLSLFESTLSQEGSTYRVIERFPLAAP
ncbi:MAG: RNA 2',3'-cyclic phosphodiesterase [Oleiphilaceae bacterium]|nr:RNA 2',3'-cyclic phosphodiesterase [Oleiphilaceae bacterium]